jgi:hypothetical protein
LRASAKAITGAATGPAGWMIVSGCVSSKSSKLAEIALTNAAPIASSRSERPMMAEVAGPLNGDSVRRALLTAGS